MTNSINELKELLTISKVAQLYNLDIHGQRGKCPKCQGSNSFRVSADKHFNCFKCGAKGSIIDLLLVTGIASSVSESVRLLKSQVTTSGTAQDYYRNKSLREKVFEVYQNYAKEKPNIVSSYCSARGWNNTYEIGLAPSSNCLTNAGISQFDLNELQMFEYEREYYDNHIVFPIYDSIGNIKHMCGRALDNRELRWKSSKGTPSIDKYFYNSHALYKPNSEYLVVCEGISDCLSLRQLGVPAISQFGINVSLDLHAEHFKHFEYIVFIYDNDKYGIGTPNENKYKSWSVTMPLVIDLVCKVHKPCYYLALPNLPGVKDVNEWLISIDYSDSIFSQYIADNVKPICELAVEMYGNNLSEHRLLWRLLSASNDVSTAEQLMHNKGVDYILGLFSEQ